MESDNSHLKRSNSSSYDPAKILIMDKNIKKLPMEVVGFAPMKQYNIQAPWGILNSQMLSSPFPFSSGRQVKGEYDAQKKYKSMLNEYNISAYNQSKKSIHGNARFVESIPIYEATCEETGVKAPVQIQEWLTDAFSFRDYLDKKYPNDDFYEREISEEQKDEMRSFFHVEFEEGEGYTGRGDEKVEYVKSFKVNPKTTPFLTKEQRKWIEQSIPLKDVKKHRITRTTKSEWNRKVNNLFAGRERGSNYSSIWAGIPALVRITPNRVVLKHIKNTTYNERNDTVSHDYDTIVVSNEIAKGLRDKDSPYYQKYILDPKVANEKAIGVKDMHADVGFQKAMPWLEFTVFKQPLPLVRKNTRYGGMTTMVKTNLYIADSRKPVATLMLWGDTADDYLEWMNNQTLGKGWNLSKDKIGDINRWREQNGYVDSLTHDRLILKAHKAWVSRKRYKNKEAWAINVSINPQHDSYLEYTGENYRFVPKDQRTNIDEMYERVKVSAPQMIIGGA